MKSIVIITTICFLMFGCRNERANDASDQSLVKVQPKTKKSLHLRSFDVVGGTDSARAELVTEGGISSSGYEGTPHNILWVNLVDGKSRWLLPNNDSIVQVTEDISTKPEESAKTPLASLFLVKADVSEQYSITGKLIISSPAGDKQELLSSDARRLEVWHIAENGQFLIMYAASTDYRVLTVDPASFKVLSTKTVSVVK